MNVKKCVECGIERSEAHYRAKERGICVFCADKDKQPPSVVHMPPSYPRKKEHSTKVVVVKENTKVVVKTKKELVQVVVKEIVYVDRNTNKVITTRPKRKKEKLPKRDRFYIDYKEASIEQRGLDFNLDIETFYALRETPCGYCGKAGGGIDRVDNSKGYVYGNCVPCCVTCNIMKRNMNVFAFLNHCRAITENSE